MAKDKTSRRTTASDRSSARVNQYLKWAGGLIGVALVFPLLFRVLNIINPPSFTEFIDPTPAQLHSIFFSGEPHLIFCTNRTGSEVPRLVKRVSDLALELTTIPGGALNDDSDLELTQEEREKAYKDGGVVHSRIHTLHVGTLDCNAPLPSGKSTLERFGLKLPPIILPGGQQPTAQQLQMISTPPLPPAFLIGNGDKPVWIPNDLFAKEDKSMPLHIVRHVIGKLTPRSLPVSNEKMFHNRCTNRKACAVILHASNSNLLKETTTRVMRLLHREFANLPVVTIDVKKYTLDLQKNLGKQEDESQSKWPRLLYFRRIPRASTKAGNEEDNKNASDLVVKSYKGSFDPSDVKAFIVNLTDPPAHLVVNTTSADGTPTKPKSSQMALLKRAPTFNYGADNFKKAPKLDRSYKKPEGKQQQQQQTTGKRSQKNTYVRPPSGAAGGDTKPNKQKDGEKNAAEREKEAAEEREREQKRREQMEAEAAEHSVEAAEGAEFGGAEDEDAEEEVVSLDEEDREL